MSRNKVVIKEINQSYFFIQDEENLKNIVKVNVFNDGDPINADLLMSFENGTYKISLGKLEKGENVLDVYVPDLGRKTKVRFSICDPQGNILDSTLIDWKPSKYWKIFLVQFSHHDLGYTDLPQNVLDEYIDFYDSIIRYCEETKDWPDEVKFKYQVEQLWSLFRYLESQPSNKVEKLLSLIRSGRVGVSALFGNEITGLMGHEEIIRLLYPTFWLKRTHNISIKVAELNDVPGLSWGLATVLSSCGINIIAPLLPKWYYGPYTPFWDEEKVAAGRETAVFWWETLDGRKVLFWYQSISFGGDIGFNEGYDKLFENLPKFLRKLEEDGYPFDCMLIRLPGGARDNSPPSLKQSMIAKEWNEKWTYPKIIVSTLDQFFDYLLENYQDILSKIPTFKGEIPDSDYPVGATSTMQATIVNRNAHDLIPTAEKFATITDKLFGLEYPWKTRIEKAYNHNILYDEHTWGSMCPFGPAQEASRIEKTLHAYKAYTLAQDVLVKSLNRISDEINIPEKGYYLIVFNGLSWKRTDIVRVPLMEPDPCGHPMFETIIDDIKKISILASSPVIGRKAYYPPIELFKKPFKIIDLEGGKEVAYQVITIMDPKAPLPFAADRVGVGSYESRFSHEILFLAENIPPLGYKVYRIEEKDKEIFPSGKVSKKEELIIENKFYRVEMDSERGIIKSLYDKELGRELLDVEAPHGFGQIIARETTTYKEHSLKNVAIRRCLDGPIANSIIVEGSTLGFPLIVEEIILYDGIKRLDLNVRALKDSAPLLELYVAFPFLTSKPRFTYEGPNIIARPQKDQFPGSHTCYYPIQHWVNVYDEDNNFSVTLSSMDAHLVMLGGLWSLGVSFAHHGATPPNYPCEDLRINEFEKGYIYSLISSNNFRTNFYMTQIGDLLLRFSLTSHEGNWNNFTAFQHGWSVANTLLPIFSEGGNKGRLPGKAASFCEIDSPNTILLILKPSEEDKEKLVLRLWETMGKEAEVKVKLPFLIIKEASHTNIVEENLEESVEVFNNNTLILNIKPFEIATIKLNGKVSKQ